MTRRKPKEVRASGREGGIVTTEHHDKARAAGIPIEVARRLMLAVMGT